MATVLADALRLDDEARAELAAELLASLDGPADPDAESAWDAEIERRIAHSRSVKPFRFSAPASDELAAAVRWYEMRRSGLGGEFYGAVVRTIDLIRTHPEIGTPRRGRLPSRQLRVTRFPYKIVYRIRDDDIYVVAVAHTSRRPGYWKDRS
jgi:toxin ParE1/3/4